MIKNIVFDIGNVLLRWNPERAIAQVFPENTDSVALTQKIFRSEFWHELNLGKITEQQLIKQYNELYGIAIDRLEKVLALAKELLVPIEGSIELLQRLHSANYPLYALTDNTHEIFSYITKKYDFWPVFKGIVMSAEVGHLKPSPEIYRYLLNHYQLNPTETLFTDDWEKNVIGAQAVGIQAVKFKNTNRFIAVLNKFGVIV